MSMFHEGKNIVSCRFPNRPDVKSVFLQIFVIRPSCYNCPFKKRYRVSDLTIWDCFSVYDFDKEMDDDKGTTRVLCHTDKGQKCSRTDIKDISKYVKKYSPDKLVAWC